MGKKYKIIFKGDINNCIKNCLKVIPDKDKEYFIKRFKIYGPRQDYGFLYFLLKEYNIIPIFDFL